MLSMFWPSFFTTQWPVECFKAAHLALLVSCPRNILHLSWVVRWDSINVTMTTTYTYSTYTHTGFCWNILCHCSYYLHTCLVQWREPQCIALLPVSSGSDPHLPGLLFCPGPLGMCDEICCFCHEDVGCQYALKGVLLLIWMLHTQAIWQSKLLIP